MRNEPWNNQLDNRNYLSPVGFKFVITNNIFQINVYKFNLEKFEISNSVWIEKSKTKQLALPTLFKRILN